MLEDFDPNTIQDEALRQVVISLMNLVENLPRDTQRDESKQATILRGVTTVLRGGRTEKWSGKAR